jgi:hypothetical protein
VCTKIFAILAERLLPHRKSIVKINNCGVRGYHSISTFSAHGLFLPMWTGMRIHGDGGSRQNEVLLYECCGEIGTPLGSRFCGSCSQSGSRGKMLFYKNTVESSSCCTYKPSSPALDNLGYLLWSSGLSDKYTVY